MNIYLKFKTSILSFFINFFNADNYHNASKFFTIYKIWNNIKLDDIEGDYIEFGIFKGKSLLHSIKTYKQFFNSNDKITFYGLDSFDGFPSDNHNFYNSNNFSTSYAKVTKTFAKYRNVKIIKGFFSDVLKNEEFNKNVYSFVFIDCDIYESSLDVFKHIDKKIVKGGFLMIDDFTSIDKNGNSIYKAFNETLNQDEYVYFTSYSNGRVFRRI
tara:strand:+ start:874 stop:1512 length:639 start_codon:yes stop_codon:yes gene_type:complete